jgi:multiple antibiotic resistance protein
MDPFGNINSYLSLVKGLNPKRQHLIVLREMGIALAIMLALNFMSKSIIELLGLSEIAIRISSGIILFLIAIKILFTSQDSPRAHLPKGEPFIFPLAVPLIVGPALMTTIILFSHFEQSVSLMALAIFVAWLISVTILYFSDGIKNILGQNGLSACERLIGMILVLIAVQRFLDGILLFSSTPPA